MDENDELNTPEAIAGYLALKHANGMSFKDVLDLHASILADQIRAFKDTQPSHWAGARIDTLADLIDPEVS